MRKFGGIKIPGREILTGEGDKEDEFERLIAEHIGKANGTRAGVRADYWADGGDEGLHNGTRREVVFGILQQEFSFVGCIGMQNGEVDFLGTNVFNQYICHAIKRFIHRAYFLFSIHPAVIDH